MICVSIQNRNLEQILSILDNPHAQMAEIRLDSCPLDDAAIEELFGNCDTPLIATCRAADGDFSETERKLALAARAGANFIDLELEAPVAVSKKIQSICRECGSSLIRSWHDFKGTPEPEYLKQIAERCVRYGADIVKVVTTAICEQDCSAIESLYGSFSHPLVAFAMGEKGRESRIKCLSCGAPFSYAAVSDKEATAPGQWDFEEMYRRIHGGAEPYSRQNLQMPASKSFAQRAILCAALADGTSRLGNYSPCDDSEAAIRVAGLLGAEIRTDGNTLEITGRGDSCGKDLPDSINVGESGLITRLMIPLAAQTGSGTFRIEGEGTLPGRALGGASDIMAAFGVVLQNERPRADREIHVPLKVCGKLIPGTAEIPGNHGSQLISGLLMALPLSEKDSTVYVNEPKSIPYMFITCDVLRKFGIRIGSQMEGNADMVELQDWSCCSGISFKIRGRQKYRAASFDLEADWSSAANFLVAGAVFGNVSLKGLDTKSLQADLSILDILVDAGAAVSELEDGTVCARQAPLNAFETDLNNAPDLFPIVSILAAFCNGTSRIAGIRRLSTKESNRAAAIISTLDRMGVKTSVESDTLSICGESLCSRKLGGRLLRGGEFSSYHDHRMAMALRVASLGTESPIVIDDEACTGKSFPGFTRLF
ncbi:MAG: type I 3-dehydroquinate dehydratase [Bacteroidales bacterium]|nr:type I 3-dehydroquinate dehydratase [Bacteroidales bacterium]